ncbi:MAG: AAA family ATPase [Algicola sp.]|nr:AAA family ATPase [Algicola sp.]
MLVYFRAENFRSIKEPIELDLRAAPRLRRLKGHVRTPANDKSLKLLKSAVLYGANASGKSNILKAIRFAQQMVTGHVIPNAPIASEPFALTENVTEESSFYFEFVLVETVFGFGIRCNEERILEENLIAYTETEDLCLYSRTHIDKENYQIETSFFDKESTAEKIELEFLIKYTPKNRLFILECEERGGFDKLPTIGTNIQNVYIFFQHYLIIIFPETKSGDFYHSLYNKKETTTQLSNLLNSLDTGVAGFTHIQISSSLFGASVISQAHEKLLNNKELLISFHHENKQYYATLDSDKKISFFRIKTVHKLPSGTNAQLELTQESDGTLRLLDLLPIISEEAIDKQATTFLIDEFDRSLHPNLAKAFLNLFLNSEHSDNDNQLIVSTHEAELLDNDLLRRDEIWFVQKEWDSASRLYCLNDYSTRFDKDIHKAYLSGKFGAVPILMDEFKK